MSLIKFSEYLEEAPDLETLPDNEEIAEWSEEEWYKLTVAERAEIEASAIDGWSKWQICEIEEDDLGEKVKKYKPQTTMRRREIMRTRDKMKFSGRADKLKRNIHNKKGGVKVHRKKLIVKRVRRNKSKIATANRVYGGKAHSKYTPKTTQNMKK